METNINTMGNAFNWAQMLFDAVTRLSNDIAEVKQQNKDLSEQLAQVGKDTMSEKEVVEYLGKSRATINRWRKQGLLTPSIVNNRPIYSRREVMSLLRSAKE